MNAFFTKKDSAKSKVLPKREEKKNINIQWNGSLVFQLSLIACGLLAFLIIESDIKLGLSNTTAMEHEVDLTEPPMTNFVVEVEKLPVVKPPKAEEPVPRPKVTPSYTFTQIDNNVATETPVIANTETPAIEPQITKIKKPEGDRNVMNVESVPVFPGCEGLLTNAEKRDCLQEKIRSFVGKKFNTDVSDQTLGGKQRILVQFKIAANGQVTDIKARAADGALEREAKRVVGRLPTMKPGLQGDVPVNVVYNLPIVFSVN